MIQLLSLVIVAIVDKNCILAFEKKGYSPVAADPNRPMSCKITFKLVKMPPWRVHIERFDSFIERKQLVFQLAGMGGLDSCL